MIRSKKRWIEKLMVQGNLERTREWKIICTVHWQINSTKHACDAIHASSLRQKRMETKSQSNHLMKIHEVTILYTGNRRRSESRLLKQNVKQCATQTQWLSSKFVQTHHVLEESLYCLFTFSSVYSLSSNSVLHKLFKMWS